MRPALSRAGAATQGDGRTFREERVIGWPGTCAPGAGCLGHTGGRGLPRAGPPPALGGGELPELLSQLVSVRRFYAGFECADPLPAWFSTEHFVAHLGFTPPGSKSLRGSTAQARLSFLS